MLIFTLHAVSASDVNETFCVEDIVFEDYDQILESDISQTDNDYDYEINMSENEIVFEDILSSNESKDYESIEYYGENINKEYGEHISYTHYSNESIDNHEEIGSITVAEIPATINLNIIHEIELEMHIFIASYEFRFYESGNPYLLILDVNVCFDNVIFKDLTKDVIVCSKKIKGDYIYSIDNSIAGDSLNSLTLSFFNFFADNHLYKFNKDSFNVNIFTMVK